MILLAADIGETVLDVLDFLAAYGIPAILAILVVLGACYGFFYVSYWVLSAVFAVHDRFRPGRPASGRLARWIRSIG